MFSKIAVLALALGASAAIVPPAQASVVYTSYNTAVQFTLFIYDLPGFITTDTTVPVSDLAFANPLNTITSVEFIPSSSTFPGTSEVAVFQSAGGPDQSFTGNQFRYYPEGTFTQFGVTPGDINSFNFPNSELIVAAPEPSTIGLLGAGLFGMFALRRRSTNRSRTGGML